MWIYILIYSIAVTISISIIVFGTLIIKGLVLKLTTNKCTSQVRLDGKTVIVTGGCYGIGLATAEDLARRGARLIIACPLKGEGYKIRNRIAKITGNKNVISKHLDLASLSSIRLFCEDILKNESRLDILLNCSDVPRSRKTTPDDLDFVLQVNYFGVFLLTILLLPLLKKTGTISSPSRVVNVASMLFVKGTVDFDNKSKSGCNRGGTIYFNSKLCVVLFTRELSKRLGKETNVIVNAADQRVSTHQTTSRNVLVIFLRSSVNCFYPSFRDGAQTSLHVALDDEAGKVNGEYFDNCKSKDLPRVACDECLSRLLWDETVKLVTMKAEEIDEIFVT